MRKRRRKTARARGSSSGTARAVADAIPSALLQVLKRRGALTIRALAAELHITYEAVRQQIAELLRAGWVKSAGAAAGEALDRSTTKKPGPASREYRLSAAAEHLFPKHYDELSAELVQHVYQSFGGAGVVEILARMTDARVRRWAPLLRGLSVREKVEALSALYEDKDAYMQVDWRQGAPALIEHNCPFFNVAQKHPAICSVSVNTLERLLGCKVVREQSFQAGHGRCVFRLRLEEARSPEEAFVLERDPLGQSEITS
ncbi:MAG TPA: winged helix-turn-helix transcriptional regulator [Steroidobacteraceae bacterium]|nr:winged helix-turn-helix transcriptional regulator [Steroidobacteraceae bacterium]